MDDDATLLARYAQTRCADAFQALAERHAGLVFGTCVRVCGNRADADDAVQEVFITLAGAANRIHGHLPAWLHRVALNAALGLRRRQRGRQALDPALAAGEPDDVRALLPLLDAAIADLPEDERRCIVARFLEGRSQQEIAAELGLSQPTVHRRLEAAVERLRKALGASGHHCVAALALAAMPVPSTVQLALGKLALVGPHPAAASAGGAGAGMGTTLVVAGAIAASVATGVVFLRPAERPVSPAPVTAPVAAPIITNTLTLPTGVWTAITPPVTLTDKAAGVLCITVDPRAPATLYAGIEVVSGGDHTDGNGLWCSRDGGQSWTLLGRHDANKDDNHTTALDLPVAVAIDPADGNHLYATEGANGHNRGFWISTDGGASWTRTRHGGLTTLAVDPSDFRHVLVGSHLGNEEPGILESRDGGRTWTSHRPPVASDVPGGSHSPAFLCDPATKQGDGDTWLVQHAGLWRTSDAGATWQQVSDDRGHRGLTDGGSLCYGPSGRLYRVTDSRLFRSRDNGQTWEDVSRGLGHANYHSVVSDGRAVWLMPDGAPPAAIWMSSSDSDTLTWTTPYRGSRPTRGPLQLRFDPRTRILYSANWSAGLWALRLP